MEGREVHNTRQLAGGQAQTACFHAALPTPFGRELYVETNGSCITLAEFRRPAPRRRTAREALLREVAAQVRAYFLRKLTVFDLPLHFQGKPFDCEVWRAVSTLEFGHFVSYGEVARAIGHPQSHRGVARAMGKTLIDLFVPAHRVIGADGRLRGCEPRAMRAKLAAFEGLSSRCSGAARS